MKRPSPSLIVAIIALVVALGGTGYAALKLPRNSVGAKQIKPNAVTSSKVRNGSLLAADFGAGQIPAGAAGAPGVKGDKGDKGDRGNDGTTGPRGPSDAYSAARTLDDTGLGPYEITLNLPPGDYDVSGTMTVQNSITNMTGFDHPRAGTAFCALMGAGVDLSTAPQNYATVPGDGFEIEQAGHFSAGGFATIAVEGNFHLGAADAITLRCGDVNASTAPPMRFGSGSIRAVRVAELH
jgi:hypothetical protein